MSSTAIKLNQNRMKLMCDDDDSLMGENPSFDFICT